MKEGFHPVSLRKIPSVGKSKYERNSDSRRGITSLVERFRQSEAFRQFKQRGERDSLMQEERDSVNGKEIRLCSTVRNIGSPLDKEGFRSG